MLVQANRIANKYSIATVEREYLPIKRLQESVVSKRRHPNG